MRDRPKTISHAGSAAGLQHRGSPQAFQMNRTYPAPANASLCECAINPSHCYRTISQRSLSVVTRFAGAQISGPPNFPSGFDIFTSMTISGQGCIPSANVQPMVFNDANNATDRRRIYDLVLFAMRASVNVKMLDASVAAVQEVADVSTLLQELAQTAYDYVKLTTFHTADRQEPWFDCTLGYLCRPFGQFVLVPPLKWVDRDPAMQLELVPAEYGAGAGGWPSMTATIRPFDGTMSIVVECLYLPDPETCPDIWPGELCPKESIGNTPWYRGAIETARRD
jgi:hypothetical protein